MTQHIRKFIGLAIATCLVILGWALMQASGAQNASSATHVSAQEQSAQMAELHEGDRPISTPMAQAPSAPVMGQAVTYGLIDGEPVTGYLSMPEGVSDSIPGVIVIHEWWGLNDNIRTMADRLAGEGYAALAVDLYRGGVAETPDDARSLVQSALETPDLLNQNLLEAHDYLVTELSAPRTGSIGWCFGGTWSLNTARLLPESLDATVIYYGGGIVTDSESLEALQMPIQGHFGALDSNPSVETVQEFEATLNTLGKNADIYIYEDANHAFANPSGTRYNADAAETAWGRTVEFLHAHLSNM
ncbi:MAG: dienelactone hydrolase family protein [Elainellaceae cyanobacterium]